MKPIVFLGGGRITGALIAGLRLSGYKGTLVVHDHNPGKMSALKKQHGVHAGRDLGSSVKQAGILIVAVRPASVSALLDEVALQRAWAIARRESCRRHSPGAV